MVIKQASADSPLTCEEFNNNFIEVLNRANHTGQQSCDTLSDLEPHIQTLSIWQNLLTSLADLETQYTNLNFDLFGNGQLASLIQDLQDSISAVINNLQNEISNLQIFIDLQALAGTNQTNISNLSQSLDTLNLTVDDHRDLIDANAASIDTLSNTTIPAIDTQVDENLTKLNKFPDPVTLDPLALNQVLYNTPDGLRWRTSETISNKAYTIPGDFNSISEALTFLEFKVLNNVTLNLLDSTYTEDINFENFLVYSQPLIIKGISRTDTEIKGNVTFSTLASYVRFQDLTLSPGNILDPGIGIYALNKCTVDLINIRVQNFTKGVCSDTHSVLYLDNVQVENCVDSGIEIINASYCNFKNTTVDNCDFGLLLRNSSSLTGENCVVENCRIGLRILGGCTCVGDNITAKVNEIGISVNGTLNLINSLLRSNTLDGLIIFDGGKATLENVTSQLNENHGFVAEGNAVLRTQDCVTSSNLTSGVSASNGSFIHNTNIISSNNDSFGFQANTNSIIYATGTSGDSVNNTLGTYNNPTSGVPNATNGLIFFD